MSGRSLISIRVHIWAVPETTRLNLNVKIIITASIFSLEKTFAEICDFFAATFLNIGENFLTYFNYKLIK